MIIASEWYRESAEAKKHGGERDFEMDTAHADKQEEKVCEQEELLSL